MAAGAIRLEALERSFARPDAPPLRVLEASSTVSRSETFSESSSSETEAAESKASSVIRSLAAGCAGSVKA